MSLIKETEKYLEQVLKSLSYEVDNVILEPSNKKELGQFQLNIAMQLAKKYHDSPMNIANKIVKELDDRFVKVNIANPGFINLSFSDEILIQTLNDLSSDFHKLVDLEEDKKIIIDYGGANAAKALHVGHMRSANIGEALKRLAKIFNKEVIGDVHLGDLGRQSGMVISELMLEQPNLPFFDSNFKGEYPHIDLTEEDLARIYPKASLKAKNDPDRMEKVREITAKIDAGDETYLELWRQIVAISSNSIKKVYDELNCHFDLWEGELSSLTYVPQIKEILKPYLYESESAYVIDVAKEDDKVIVPPLIVIKNDGATIYATRDLATIYSRMTKYHPDEIWYVVDERQALYFDQVFRASYKSGLVNEKTRLFHFGFGTINGQDNKPYKTRDGGVMPLATLIDLVKEQITSKIKEEIKGEERTEIANKLTIATIKYMDLLPYRKTDYIFDPVKFSSFEGKTGPYILYTLVRIKSLLSKSDLKNVNLTDISEENVKNMCVKILELSRVLTKSYHEKTLNYLTEYLYELTSLYNKFYTNINVLKEQDLNKQRSYLKISLIIQNIMENILDILAIEPVSKM